MSDGLWANIHAKRKRIKAGSGEKMRTPGSKGAPTDKAIVRSQSKKKGPVSVATVGMLEKRGLTTPVMTPAWTRKEGKDPSGGLNTKGRASYTKGELKPPAPNPKTKESKGRKKSFCARMSGMKKKLTSSKTANDPNSRINKSLRKWNCN